LKEYATDKPDSPEPQSAQSPVEDPAPEQTKPAPPAFKDLSLQWEPKGKLIREGGGMRFMDSYLLGTIYDEVCTLPRLEAASRPDVLDLTLSLLGHGHLAPGDA
jgi:hypothetical protein